MSTISAIYDGIKTVLDANLTDGGRVYTDWPDNPLEYPAIIPRPFSSYQAITIGGHGFQLVIPIEVRVQSASQGEALDALYDYISPAGTKSLIVAIEAERTLDGSVDDAKIEPLGQVARDADNERDANEWHTMFNLTVVKQVS